MAVRDLGNGFHQVVAHYGFMEQPNIPALLASLPPASSRAAARGAVDGDLLLPGAGDPAPRRTVQAATWRKQLFIVMSRNARPASAFFGLPPNRVVELGAQIQF